LTTKTWYLGRVCRMHYKIGNRWIKYWQLIDLWNQPTNTKMMLGWYENKNGLMWTYDLPNHSMLKVETIITLATLTYIVETNLYEWHPTDEQVFNDFINEKWIFLAKSIVDINSIWSLWRTHMIIFYVIYLDLTCVCNQGDFLAKYCTCLMTKRGEVLYIKGIKYRVTHARGSWF
jgi:hypothetical protein